MLLIAPNEELVKEIHSKMSPLWLLEVPNIAGKVSVKLQEKRLSFHVMDGKL